jgi:alkylhydroperoxidase family enzyme
MSSVVPLIDRPRGLLRRCAWRYSRRQFGKVVDPVRALSHHGGMLVSNGLLEMAATAGWRRLDPHLRWLAVQAASGSVGCTWCIDFGFYEALHDGVDPRKVRDVPRWRESEVYTDQERLVLEYAEAASATPVAIDDALAERLRATFDDAEIVELCGWVALENYRSRTNAALGLHSQGFADSCDVLPVGA